MEVGASMKNTIWELKTFPKNHRAIGVKWVYKGKKNVHEDAERYKASLVAKGYKQRHGIDYEESIHLLRAKKEVEFKYVKSHDQVADIFTKPLKF